MLGEVSCCEWKVFNFEDGTTSDTDENISPVENPIFAILTKIHL